VNKYFVLLLVVSAMLVPAAGAYAAPDDEPLITMDFRDTEIHDILRALADHNDLNIVTAKDVRGKITVQFSDVTLDEALDSIVSVNGYAYSRSKNVIRITTTEAVAKEPLTTEVILLSNIDPSGLKEALVNAVSPNGNLTIHEGTNSIIITDHPSRVEKIKSLIAGMDTGPAQIKIEAKIIEAVLSKEENLGIDWTIKVAANGASRPTTFPFKTFEHQQVMYPENELQWSYDDANNRIDVTSDFPLRRRNLAATGADAISLGAFPYAKTTDFMFGRLGFSEFQAVLEMLDKRGNTELLSSPRIVTTDNRMAEIHVGQNMPIPTYAYNNERGVWEVTGYEEQKIGITLTVTPHIVGDDYITLDIRPRINDIIAFTGPNDERPITSTREATTQVKIKSGEVVAIGGLIKEKTISVDNRVPILGKIPILGYLFRKKGEDKEKTDLLIFVSAEIMK
jgi:type IV pilus assembly protein PilQ